MMKFSVFSLLVWFCLVFSLADCALTQLINVGTPFTSTSDRYFENIGVGFGFTLPGGQGNSPRVVGLAPNGRLTPNLNFGWGNRFGGPGAGGGFLAFGQRGGHGGFSLGVGFAKGSQRSIVSTAPYLTVQNGFGGSIFSGQVRPFVTGVIPIVGTGGVQPAWSRPTGAVPLPVDLPVSNAVTQAISSGQLNLAKASSPNAVAVETDPIHYSDDNSTAMDGDASVEAIRAANAQRRRAIENAIETKLDEAKTLVDRGELSLARSKYREVLQITNDAKINRQIKSLIAATRKK